MAVPHRAETATLAARGVTRRRRERRRRAPLDALPSRISSRTHGALRGAVDVELIGGFLWATAGYAYTTAGTPAQRLSPTFGDLGGHTVAARARGDAGGFTITLGWARTWSVASDRSPAACWQLDNPFGAGDAEVPRGTYDGSSDLVGLMLEVELPVIAQMLPRTATAISIRWPRMKSRMSRACRAYEQRPCPA